MEINEHQRKWCLNIIDQLYKWKLTAFFRHPVDPEAEGLEDYFKIIKKPMDLDTVKKTLYDGNYPSIEAFLTDLHLIWDNTKLFNGKDSIMTYISDEILNWLEKKEKLINKTEDEIWLINLKEIESKIQEHMKNKPMDKASQNTVNDTKNIKTPKKAKKTKKRGKK